MVRAWRRFGDGRGRRWRAEGHGPSLAEPRFTTRPAGARRRSARVLFINQYYWPSHASTAQHLTDLAESLAERGFECHVLCDRGGHAAGPARRPKYEVHNGVHIHRVAATTFGRRSTIGRMADYLSFYVQAALLALGLPRFDVVATLTTPPIIGLIGTLLRRLKGSKHVYWSMDLHPDASIALGRMSPSNPVVSALARLSDAVYRRADRVVVLGSYMEDRVLAKGVRPGRVAMIPVWSRADEIYPLPRRGHPLRAALGLEGKFVAMYSGNLGLAHAFDEFLAAARRMKGRTDVVFLFVGDGPRRAEVEAARRAERLDNIQVLDYFPRDQLHASLSLADVHLISMRREMTGVVVPSKLYGAMASARPVLFVGPEHCEAADTIRESQCGLSIRLGDVAGLVEAIDDLAADLEAAASMGRRGRLAFLEDFERDACCDQWSTLITALAGEVHAPVAMVVPV